MSRPATAPASRFEDKYIPEPNTGCWLWIGSETQDGYGRFRANGLVRAHRFSYEMHKGPIPNGMRVCHQCDVRCCVNPDHLFVGTAADNSADMVSKGRSTRTLTTKDVQEIRGLWAAGGTSKAEIGRKFGVSGPYVGRIVRKVQRKFS